MDDVPAFMSLAAYARHHQVSKPTCTGWKRRGHIMLTADGKVDVVVSNARLAARPSISRGGRTKVRPGKPLDPGGAGVVVEQSGVVDPATWSRQEALRQREIAQARLAQIEADRAAGLVVLKADVVGAVSAEYVIIKTAFLGLASKLAPRLAAATTPEQCGDLVDGEVRQILTELTQDAPK
jgi:hypothetical protein